jgi:hypothetical protein
MRSATAAKYIGKGWTGADHLRRRRLPARGRPARGPAPSATTPATRRRTSAPRRRAHRVPTTRTCAPTTPATGRQAARTRTTPRPATMETSARRGTCAAAGVPCRGSRPEAIPGICGTLSDSYSDDLLRRARRRSGRRRSGPHHAPSAWADAIQRPVSTAHENTDSSRTVARLNVASGTPVT